MNRVVELTSGLAGNEDIEIYTTASAMQNYTGMDGEETSGFIRRLKKRTAARQQRKLIKTQSKAAARTAKADAKKGEAVAKQLSAKASEAGVKGDIALADALKEKPTEASAKKGLSTGAWIGIGAGVLALVGLGAWLLLKKKK